MNIKEKIHLRLESVPNLNTRSNKKSIIKTFVKFIGQEKGSYDEYDAIKFFSWAKTHYSGQSILLIYQTIKWLYKSLNMPFNNIPIPTSEEAVNTFVMPNEYVERIISHHFLYSRTLETLSAVSTTYGLRRIEMQRITPEDIDIEHSRLFVRTAKSGKTTQRWMYMPDEIKPALDAYRDHYKLLTPATISAYFWLMCDSADVPIQQSKRIGWHSIRRALIIALTNSGLSDNSIIQFMRWKSKDAASSILYRYRATQSNEEIMEKIDKKIMEIHPFLDAWHV